MTLSAQKAEITALRALGWLIANDDLRDVFLGASGAAAQDLRARAQEPEFLASVLDFLLMDDAWIIGFCDAEGLGYDVVATARAALPGGAQLHWT
ncbi:MAG: DUF3572 domain-containing protein [Rhodobacteraceae bacterium]|jgi:hypothetical protein|nr:DUF3572 domain-containing protein [Paracoccaceae bacterium]